MCAQCWSYFFGLNVNKPNLSAGSQKEYFLPKLIICVQHPKALRNYIKFKKIVKYLLMHS